MRTLTSLAAVCGVAIVLLFGPALPPVHRMGTAPAVRVFVEPDSGVDPVVAFIDAARSRLDGEVYLASSKPVLAALERAAAHGVHVRVLLEQHPYGTGSAVPALVYRSLQAHGVSVGWANPAFRYTHAKFLVEPDRGQVLIGTMNWTTSAFTKNREFRVIDGDPHVVQESEAVFAADLRRVRRGAATSDSHHRHHREHRCQPGPRGGRAGASHSGCEERQGLPVDRQRRVEAVSRLH